MKSADELFKSITGFEEVDVNFLEGIHTTYNSLSSRFEIALDDNRNASYPFEYCWNKTNEGKAKSGEDDDDEEESEEDDFEEMWTHSVKEKVVDSATNFAKEIDIDETQGSSLMIDKKVKFGKVIDEQVKEDIGRSSIEKKS